MEKYIEKAKILIEALPYIQQFKKKTMVIKYGGSFMYDEARKQSVMDDISLMRLVGIRLIIVHGGDFSRSDGEPRLQGRHGGATASAGRQNISWWFYWHVSINAFNADS